MNKKLAMMAVTAAFGFMEAGCSTVQPDWSHAELAAYENSHALSRPFDYWKVGESHRFTHVYAAMFLAKSDHPVSSDGIAPGTMNSFGSVAVEQTLDHLTTGITAVGLGLGLVGAILPDPESQTAYARERWTVSRTSVSLVRFDRNTADPKSQEFRRQLEDSFTEGHELLTALDVGCVPRLIADKRNIKAPQASVLGGGLAPSEIEVMKGTYHFRIYSCRENLEASVIAQRVTDVHPLASKGMKDKIVSEVRLYQHDTQKEPQSNTLYTEIKSRVPAGWVAVYPGTQRESGALKMYVADAAQTMAFDPPR